MIAEKILVWRFNNRSRSAFQRIYEKYKDDLLGLAVTLLRDRSVAEDVMHDVFVSFAQKAGTFRLSGTLNGYLSTCVANRARDRNRSKSGKAVGLDVVQDKAANSNDPADRAVLGERAHRLAQLLACLPDQQREVIVLHLHREMSFREIAHAMDVSINTVQSRYRYGLNKLRVILNGEVAQ